MIETRLFAMCGVALLLGALPARANGAEVSVEQMEIHRFALPAGGPTLVHLPYFDAQGALQFNEEPVSLPPEMICAKTGYVRAVLARPRVDYWQCADGKSYLAGTGRDAWARALEFPSGSRRIALYLMAAGSEGLVLSDLEVWSAANGKTLRAAPVREITKEQRSVPRYSFSRRGAYPAGKDFFLFATATELEGGPGVYQLNPSSGEARLLMSSVRDRAAPVEVGEIQLDTTGRYLLLAELSLFRGPNWTRFVVFDLTRRERVFEQRHGEGSIVHDPRIIVGPDGHVAFAYRDGGKRQTVVVEYQLRPAPGPQAAGGITRDNF